MKTTMMIVLVCLVAATSGVSAKDRAPPIAKGSQIGVVNLLDQEVMQYHAARDYKDRFVKMRAVQWPIDEMLTQALKERLAAQDNETNGANGRNGKNGRNGAKSSPRRQESTHHANSGD